MMSLDQYSHTENVTPMTKETAADNLSEMEIDGSTPTSNLALDIRMEDENNIDDETEAMSPALAPSNAITKTKRTKPKTTSFLWSHDFNIAQTIRQPLQTINLDEIIHEQLNGREVAEQNKQHVNNVIISLMKTYHLKKPLAKTEDLIMMIKNALSITPASGWLCFRTSTTLILNEAELETSLWLYRNQPHPPKNYVA
jgi:hypothetical protein